MTLLTHFLSRLLIRGSRERPERPERAQGTISEWFETLKEHSRAALIKAAAPVLGN